MIEPIYRRPRRFNEARSCAGKGRWRTERAAQQAVRSKRVEFPGQYDSTVRPYRCSGCKHWHIGHES